MNASLEHWSTWDVLVSGNGSSDDARCLADDVTLMINGESCAESRDEFLDLHALFHSEHPGIDIEVTKDIRTDENRAIEWVITEESLGSDSGKDVYGVSVLAAAEGQINSVRHIFDSEPLQRITDGLTDATAATVTPRPIRAVGH